MFARVMHYFGYKYHELASLDYPTYDYLVQLMNIAKANDHLELKEIISYPHLKKEDMNNVHKRLIMNASSEKMRAEKAVTSDQLASLGIQVPGEDDYKKYVESGGKQIKKSW